MSNNQFFQQGQNQPQDGSQVTIFYAKMPADVFAAAAAQLATGFVQAYNMVQQPAAQQLTQGNQSVAPQFQQLPPAQPSFQVLQPQPNMYEVRAIAADGSVWTQATVVENSAEYWAWLNLGYQPIQSTAGTWVLASPSFWQPYPAAQQQPAPQPQPNQGTAQHGNQGTGSGNRGNQQGTGNNHGNGSGNRVQNHGNGQQGNRGNNHGNQQGTTPPPAVQPQSFAQNLIGRMPWNRPQGTHS